MHYLAEGDQYVKDGAWAVTLSSGFKFNNSNYVESRLSTFQVLILFVLTCMALLLLQYCCKEFQTICGKRWRTKIQDSSPNPQCSALSKESSMSEAQGSLLLHGHWQICYVSRAMNLQ